MSEYDLDALIAALRVQFMYAGKRGNRVYRDVRAALKDLQTLRAESVEKHVAYDECRKAREEALEEVAKMLEAWCRPDELRLQAGEMTSRECRTVIAALKSRAAAIRQLKDKTNE